MYIWWCLNESRALTLRSAGLVLSGFCWLLYVYEGGFSRAELLSFLFSTGKTERASYSYGRDSSIHGCHQVRSIHRYFLSSDWFFVTPECSGDVMEFSVVWSISLSRKIETWPFFTFRETSWSCWLCLFELLNECRTQTFLLKLHTRHRFQECVFYHE